MGVRKTCGASTWSSRTWRLTRALAIARRSGESAAELCLTVGRVLYCTIASNIPSLTLARVTAYHGYVWSLGHHSRMVGGRSRWWLREMRRLNSYRVGEGLVVIDPLMDARDYIVKIPFQWLNLGRWDWIKWIGIYQHVEGFLAVDLGSDMAKRGYRFALVIGTLDHRSSGLELSVLYSRGKYVKEILIFC